MRQFSTRFLNQVVTMSNSTRALTAARLTPAGRGAVATIRVCGNLAMANAKRSSDTVSATDVSLDSLFVAANGMSLLEQPLRRISFGKWGLNQPEELVVCRQEPEVLEIHCHGGLAAVQRVLNDLQLAGCAIVDWRDQRSTTEDDLSVVFSEVLSQTSTWRTTQLVLAQTNGLLREAFERLRSSDASDNRLVDELLQWSDFGVHLTKPWKIVLTGRPNVGKSSLINALLGYQRAIVFDQPGTTRDVVTAETAFDGWPMLLADTAGMRDATDPLEAAGMKLAQEQLAGADLPIVLIDLGQQPTAEDRQLIATCSNAIVVAHKADLIDRWGDELPTGSIRVSSVTGLGIEDLQREIVRRLIPDLPPAGTPVPLTPRQVDLLRQIRSASTAQQRQVAVDQLFSSGPRGGGNRN